MTVADLPRYFAREAAIYRLGELREAAMPAARRYAKNRAAALKGREKPRG